MKKNYPLLGLLGGTFDPIHCGHLYIAEQCYQDLHMSSVLFIPNKVPTHRIQPIANDRQRLDMVHLALQNKPYFQSSDIEIQSSSPSFTVLTLQKLYQLHPKNALCFILGSDAFATFNTWNEYQEILNYCHLIIVNRPDFHFTPSTWLTDLFDQHLTQDASKLHQHRQGCIFLQKIKPYPTSASLTRQRLAQGIRQDIDLPESVKAYIEQEDLYQ